MTLRKRRLAHDQHVFLLSIAAGAPAVVTSILLLAIYVEDPKVRWTVGALVLLVWLFTSLVLREWVHRPFVFLGLIGSKRKRRLIFEQFVQDGLATEDGRWSLDRGGR